jgi:hypothetical protein
VGGIGVAVSPLTLLLFLLLVFGIDEGILESCEGAIWARLAYKLERGDLSRSQEVVAPGLVRQPAGPMTTLRILLGLPSVIDPFLDVLDVVDQARAAGLEVSDFVLDPVAGDGSDVLGQAVFGLSNLPIDLAEMKISILLSHITASRDDGSLLFVAQRLV